MSLKSTRALAVAGVGAIAALGAVAPANAAVSLTQVYTCNYPLISNQATKIDITVDLPTTWPAGQATPEFAINAVATLYKPTVNGMDLVAASNLEGTALANATIVQPGNPTPLPLRIPITVAKGSVPPPNADPNQTFTLNTFGKTPPLTFPQAGTASVSMTGLTFQIKATDDAGALVPLTSQISPDPNADGDASTFTVPCSLDAGQPTKVSDITITGEGPVPTPTPTPSGPTPTPTPPGPTPTPTPTPTPGGPTPSPTPQLIPYKFSLKGTTVLKTLTQGSLPLTGSIDAKLDLATGDFLADLVLNKTRGKLTLFGLVPLTADVGFVPSGQTTGSLRAGVLNTSSKLKIRLPQLYLFGAIPIAGPGTCQTRQYSTVNLKSTAERFQPLVGGPVFGTYAISDLTGCGALNGLISPLAAGGGNTINANLTPIK